MADRPILARRLLPSEEALAGAEHIHVGSHPMATAITHSVLKQMAEGATPWELEHCHVEGDGRHTVTGEEVPPGWQQQLRGLWADVAARPATAPWRHLVVAVVPWWSFMGRGEVLVSVGGRRLDPPSAPPTFTPLCACGSCWKRSAPQQGLNSGTTIVL